MNNFLQSEPWARFHEDLGHTVFRNHGEGWSYLATLEGGRWGRYLYCPYGPEAESPESFDAALADLLTVARKHRCLFVRVEPTQPEALGSGEPADQLRQRGMHLSPRQIQPSHTWMVDLTPSTEEILRGFSSSNRNRHRNIHKKGVTFEVSQDPQDIQVLLTYLHQTAERLGFNRQKDDYLTQAAHSLLPTGDACLYLVKLHGEPIGAAFAYDSADTRTYAHSSVDFAHRRLSANSPLVSHMILDAKGKGLSRFDMFGIAPDGDPDHEWAGFTEFKKSFGGYPVTYPGTWDLPVNQATYRAFTTLYAAKDQTLPRLRSLLTPALHRAARGRDAATTRLRHLLGR